MKPLPYLKGFLTHPYVVLLLRFYIGGIFIYAGIHKINHTGQFLLAIATYGVVPFWACEILAEVLPWVELISGILLVAGIGARYAASLIGLLLVMFSYAIFINLLRHTKIPCRCFSAGGSIISWWTFLRDIIWLLMAIYLCSLKHHPLWKLRFRAPLREA